jgi:AraC-like DNA-binding protein
VDFETSDADLAQQYLADMYGRSLRTTGLGTGSLRHSRMGAGSFAVDDIELPMELDFAADSLGLLIVELRAGGGHRDLGGVHEEAGPGDVLLLTQPGLPYRARYRDTHSRAVSLDMSLLARALPDAPPGPARFTGYRPATCAAGRHWARTVDYLTELLANPEASAQPLIIGTAARHLAATALATFPNTMMPGHRPCDRTDATPPTLRRAVEFIESHAGSDICLGDVAAALRVTPRAVQQAFRRHLETTPTEYLRRVRLERAHRDLLAADAGRGETVAAIARRWGFHSLSRFADRYRAAYGEPPSRTLRT